MEFKRKKIIFKEISNYIVLKNYQGFHPIYALSFIKSIREQQLS